MSRRSAILLHNKLSELESELVEAFRFPPHSASDLKTSRRLQKRFEYINNLLSAEVASAPEKSDQLDGIGEKLGGLEAVFHCWTEYLSYALNIYRDDAPMSICYRCIDRGDDDVAESGRLATEYIADGKEGEKCGRSWGRLYGAFGCGVIVGVICCTTIINFASFYFLQYQHLYFIPPT